MLLHGTSCINGEGNLEIGGCDTINLAHRFGTPLYVYDEELIRENCRRFINAFAKSGLSYQVAYASKAFSCIAMCELAEEERMSLDVVSSGELYTALKAGFPVGRIHFHGNNKTIEELQMALDAQIGCFVVDNFYELDILHDLAFKREQKVNILLRLTPGVEVHTHEYIKTGQLDSKFGFNIANGQALKAIQHALNKPHYKLLGLHTHIGSQIFATKGFVDNIKIIAKFMQQIKRETGFEVEVLNLGGGFGIQYTEADDPLPIEEYVNVITSSLQHECAIRNHLVPAIWVEPGRSIVGNAATTLYTVGSIKEVPGVRKYVAVDGGMTDNIRPALYQAEYQVIVANKADMHGEEVVSIAGKCCESGDMLAWDVTLPLVKAGDFLAITGTGAYGYSMSSNYNRLRRPTVLFVRSGRAEIVVKGESYEDLIRNDCRISISVAVS